VRYISHELRTPLNTAFLGLKLLTNELKASNNPKDTERYDTLCDVNVSCTAAVDILNDLLCYEKLESGILELHKENIVVDSFLKECASMFSAQARECGVTISTVTDTPQTAPPLNDPKFSFLPLLPDDVLFADKFKMDQVVRNLMSNALKFTPRGGVVTIRTSFLCDTSGDTVKGVVNFGPERGVDTVTTASHGSSTPADNFSKMRTKEFPVSRGLGVIDEYDRDYGSQSCVNYPASGLDTSFLTDCLHGKLIVVVTDTGAGISKENQARLFNEIVQFSPEKLQAGGGSGLGLWITQEILNLHDGSISVSSEGEGMGSSFTIELPMTRWSNSELSATVGRGLGIGLGGGGGASLKSVTTGMDLPAPALDTDTDEIPSKSEPESESQSKPQSEPETFHKREAVRLDVVMDLHVLVVDDSRLNRKMLLKCLRADGHICFEAEDGLEAVAMVKERIGHATGGNGKPFDAVLMDFVMPNMDGPTATKEIRTLGYTSPIFGVTGNGEWLLKRICYCLRLSLHLYHSNKAPQIQDCPLTLSIS
jgi:signal transduction histidine kinase